MLIRAQTALNEFNVTLPGAYFPHTEMWEGLKQDQYLHFVLKLS